MAHPSSEHRLWSLVAISFALHGGGLGLVAFEMGSEPSAVSSRSPIRRDVWAGNDWEVELARPELGAPAEFEAPRSAASRAEPAPKRAPPPAEAAARTAPEPALEKSAQPVARSRVAPSARASSSAAESSGSIGAESTKAESSGAGVAGPGGALGQAATWRDLPTAFTRAIPPAASRDPAWREHALGSVGVIRLRLTLGEDGRIASHEVLRRRGEEVAPELEGLVRRVVALLGGGQFALRQGTGRAGVQELQVEVTLARGEPSPEAEPTETVRLGFDAPAESAPGRAFFRLGSGLGFEAIVRLSSVR